MNRYQIQYIVKKTNENIKVVKTEWTHNVKKVETQLKTLDNKNMFLI